MPKLPKLIFKMVKIENFENECFKKCLAVLTETDKVQMGAYYPNERSAHIQTFLTHFEKSMMTCRKTCKAIDKF